MANVEEIIAWLRLVNTDGIGPIGFEKLVQKCGSAENAVCFMENSGKKLAQYDWAKNELENAYEQGIRIILKKDKNVINYSCVEFCHKIC